MYPEQSHYLSYLLRLWQEKSEGKLAWRASLESPLTGERWGFAGVSGLMEFLEKMIGKYARDEDLPREL